MMLILSQSVEFESLSFSWQGSKLKTILQSDNFQYITVGQWDAQGGYHKILLGLAQSMWLPTDCALSTLCTKLVIGLHKLFTLIYHLKSSSGEMWFLIGSTVSLAFARLPPSFSTFYPSCTSFDLRDFMCNPATGLLEPGERGMIDCEKFKPIDKFDT